MKELIKKIPFIRTLVAKLRKLIMKYFSEVGYVCKHINQFYGYVRNFKKISQSKKLSSRVESECVAQVEQLQKHGFCHIGLEVLEKRVNKELRFAFRRRRNGDDENNAMLNVSNYTFDRSRFEKSYMEKFFSETGIALAEGKESSSFIGFRGAHPYMGLDYEVKFYQDNHSNEFLRGVELQARMGNDGEALIQYHTDNEENSIMWCK